MQACVASSDDPAIPRDAKRGDATMSTKGTMRRGDFSAGIGRAFLLLCVLLCLLSWGALRADALPPTKPAYPRWRSVARSAYILVATLGQPQESRGDGTPP